MSNIPLAYENVDWSFFHWDEDPKHEGRPSDVTMTTRSGNSHTIFRVTLPPTAAHVLEKALEEEQNKRMVENFRKIENSKEREVVKVGQVIEYAPKSLGIIYSLESMCGDAYIVTEEGDDKMVRYADISTVGCLLQRPNKRKWAGIINKAVKWVKENKENYTDGGEYQLELYKKCKKALNNNE